MRQVAMRPEDRRVVARRAAVISSRQRRGLCRRTDRLFAWLLAIEWLTGIAAAVLLSPRAGSDPTYPVHLQIRTALGLGGAIVCLPIALALERPGRPLTRHAVAAGRMLMGTLLIHLGGGRVETHLYVFGSLAFLAFYRDWRILVTATAVLVGDHLLGGIFWPRSLFGNPSPSSWRWVELAGWVAIEDFFLMRSCLLGIRRMREAADRKAEAEVTRRLIVRRTRQRAEELRRTTRELKRQIVERERTEEALRRSESEARKLALVASRTDNAVVITDTQGRIEWVNDGFTRITEYTLSEVVGRKPGAILQGPETDPDVVAFMRERLRADEGFRVEVLNYAKSGRRYWLAVEVQPIRDEDGRLVHFIAIESDISERKRTDEMLRRLSEQALHESRERLRTVVTSVPIILFALDRDGIFTLSEGRGLESLGLQPGELVGRSAFEVYRDVPQMLNDVRRALAGETFHSITERAGLSFENRYSPLHDPDGTIIGAIGVATDITELRRAEAKYRGIFENAIEGIFQSTPEGRFLSANPALVRLYGFASPEEMLDKLTDIAGQLYVEPGRRAEFIRQMDEHGTVKGFESAVLRQDGTVIWISEDARALRDARGEVLYYEGSVRDITERNGAEEERDRLVRVVEECHDFIGITTLDGRAEYVNRAGRELVGISDPETVLRTSILDYVLPEDRPFVREQILPIVLERGRWEGDFTFRHFETGAAIPVSWNIFAIRDARSDAPLALATVTRNITERKRAEEEIHRLNAHLERRLERIAALHRIDLAITASPDLQPTLGVVLEQVRTQLRVDAASVLLYNPHVKALRFAAGQGFRTEAVAETPLDPGECLATRTVQDRTPVRIDDLSRAEGSFPHPSLLKEEGFAAYHAMPLVAQDHVKGVLEVFHRGPLAPDPEWLNFLKALAGQTAIAVDNAELFADLQRSNAELTYAYDATIEGWSRALDLRDRETEGHTRRVTEMTLRLARASGLEEAELVHIRRGSILHDIGKMGIPDSILLKPGPLNTQEREIMRRHPTYAYEWLRTIPYLTPALEIPYCHHERWDGTGYPRGLKGEEIPLSARIFAAVDVWDALRSDRPYRKGWPETRVRSHIRRLAGTHLDPNVVRVFLQSMPVEGASSDPPSDAVDDTNTRTPQRVDAPPSRPGSTMRPGSKIPASDDGRELERRSSEGEIAEQLRLANERNVYLESQRRLLTRVNARLAESSTTDDLTGLKNRHHFRQALEAAFSFAVRQGQPLTVVVIDLDHFQRYNHAYGRRAGDDVLRAVAELLSANVRPHDVVVRYGGEEFAILLAATDANSGRCFAERLRRTFADHPWPFRPLSASFGLATMPPDVLNAIELVEEAERALAAAKHQGCDGIVHCEDLAPPTTGRLKLRA